MPEPSLKFVAHPQEAVQNKDFSGHPGGQPISRPAKRWM